MRGIFKILIRSFEEAVIKPVHLYLGQQVGAKKYTVSVLEEKSTRSVRLPPQFGRARTDIDQQIGQSIHLLSEKAQVLATFGTMRAYECCRRMAGNHSVALLQQCPF